MAFKGPSPFPKGAGPFHSRTAGRRRAPDSRERGREIKAKKAIALPLLAGLLLAAFACGGGVENEATPGTETPCPSCGDSWVVDGTPLPPGQVCVPQVPAEGQANLFRNPGFESGENPWCVMHLPKFEVSQEQSHTGQSSALLQMQVPAGTTGTRVYYLVHEVEVQEFPELISGYYRVEKWARGTPRQYLQFVVIALGATNMPGGFSNHQVRYPLAGISEDPFAISNAFFVYIGTEEPAAGQWVYFERNIKQDFQSLWGAVPQGFSKIRVLFEVRFDDKEAGAPAEAEVYYDDLYMGPASENPNSPD